MSDVSREKILRINTGSAEKNVKSLKTQIRELKEQMAGLEKGTEEYNRVAKQLADTNQKQIEINEAMKYSNKDLGATLSNLTTVSAGVVGSISAINGVMSLMGVEGEEAQKAMMKIQSLMAIVQGLSAIDTAIKALNGLKNAFSGLSKVKGAATTTTLTSAGAEAVEAAALANNTDKIIDNNAVAAEYDEIQLNNAESTTISTDAILKEAQTLGLNTSELQKNLNLKQNVFASQREFNRKLGEDYINGIINEEEYQKLQDNEIKKLEDLNLKIQEETNRLRENIIAKKEELGITNANAGAEAKETTATNVNTNAKTKNTLANNANAKSQKLVNNTTKEMAPAMAGATKGVNAFTKALKGIGKAVPWIFAISVAIGALSAMFGKASDEEEKMKQRLQDYQDMLNNINKTIEEGKVHVDVLLERLSNSNSLSEKKLIIDELNKEIPNFNGKVDETTKAVTYSEEALKKYNKALEERTKLKAYESQLADLKAQRAEYDLMMRVAQHSPLKKKQWEEAKANLQQVEAQIRNIELLIKQIDLGAALSLDNKDKGGGAKTVVRTVKEMLVDIKALYKEILGDMTKSIDTKNMFNGIYDALSNARIKIFELVSGSIGTKAGEAFTKDFAKAIENGFKDFDFYSVTVDQVFNQDMINQLSDDLIAERQLLEKYLNKEIKVSETVIKKQKEKVTALTTEVNTIREVLDAIVALGEEERKQALKAKEIDKWNRSFEQTKLLHEELMADVRSNNPYKEINQSISSATYSLENFKNELSELDEEENRLNSLGISNKQITDRLEEIAKRRREIELEIFDLKMNLENAYHEHRKVDIEEILKKEEADYTAYYDKVEKKVKGKAWEQEEHDLDWGQTDNYNTAVREVENTVKMLEAQMDAVEAYYDELMSQFEENSVEWINLEIEKNATLEELDRQHMENSVKLEQEKSRRRLNIAKTYVSAYNALSNQIGSILSAQMERYDENSKEYKNLKYAQGVMNTAEGVLAAFMSGIDSGIPAPWNLALAAAMSGIALTAGIMQLNNIKNEKLGGSMPNSVNIGTEYDTLSYQTNVDTLSAIQDQRVIVVESDITDTQNRVEVAESGAIF